MKQLAAILVCMGITSMAVAEETSRQSVPANQTLVTVNGRPVTGIDMIIFNAQRGGKPIDSEQAQMSVMNNLIDTIVIAQAAESSNLANDPQVKAALELARLKVLAESQARMYLANNPVSDEQIKAEYEKQFSPENLMEYHSRHILVDSEEKAQEIIAALDQGGDFAALARENSLDGSKSAGGDIGWLETTQLVKPYGDALKELKKGDFTKTPINTQFGWHVVYLVDTRPKQPPAFDDVKSNLATQLQQTQLNSYINSLRNQAKVEVAELKGSAAGSSN